MDKQKIIVLDYLVYIHIVGYCKQMPEYGLKYSVLNMITSHLRKIGLNENDVIIVAKDKIRGIDGGCWRKLYEKQYKHGRAEAREQSGRNWSLIWRLTEQLQEQLEWIGIQFLELPTFEADDFFAVLPKVITDKEFVFVTIDSDIEQMWYYPNVKIFSQKKKYKGGKGAYKIKPKNFDIVKFIAKKIKKEVSDGLDKDIVTEEDYDNRKLCVDLINLPTFVTEPLKEIINKIDYRANYSWSEMPYWNKFQERIQRAYAKSDVITYEQCIKYYAKKDAEKKIKTAKINKEKRAAKKAAKVKEESK